MEASILKSTKKILGLSETYTAFDQDVIMHINAAFSVLNELGIGPVTGFMIEDETAKWADFPVPMTQLNLVKSVISLRVRMLFDPPTLSFMITAMQDQIKEFEWRLNMRRENDTPSPDLEEVI